MMNSHLRFSAGLSGSSLRGVVAVSCAVVLLSACASFKGIETSGTLRQAKDYSTAESCLTAWTVPDTKWAQAIGGAPLQSLIDEAIAGNPDLQIAAARVAAPRR